MALINDHTKWWRHIATT